MNKFLSALLLSTIISASYASENPFFNGYDNQITLNLGYGTNHGFLLSPPTQWVPFSMIQIQYSQPSTFFRIPARQSLNVIQTIGFGKKYGWHWDKYTIPIAMLTEDIMLFSNCNWYGFTGVGVGIQAQQNERIGSKLLFGFKVGIGYRISDCMSIEGYMQHMSNANTAPENNSYAFYGLGLSFNF